MTVAVASPLALVAADLRSAFDVATEAASAVDTLAALVGQLRHYIDTLQAAVSSGGAVDPDELQGIRDLVSELEETIRGIGQRATAATKANQLPGTTLPPSPPDVPGGGKAAPAAGKGD